MPRLTNPKDRPAKPALSPEMEANKKRPTLPPEERAVRAIDKMLKGLERGGQELIDALGTDAALTPEPEQVDAYSRSQIGTLGLDLMALPMQFMKVELLEFIKARRMGQANPTQCARRERALDDCLFDKNDLWKCFDAGERATSSLSRFLEKKAPSAGESAPEHEAEIRRAAQALDGKQPVDARNRFLPRSAAKE